MSDVRVYYSDLFKLHRDELGTHPESPERLNYVLEGIKDAGINHVKSCEPDYTVDKALKLLSRVHSTDYISYISSESAKGPHYIDSDTYVNNHTFRVASLAFITSYEASLKAFKSNAMSVAIVRPPGHHAGRKGKALGAPTNGFCIFNNCAAAVLGFKDCSVSRILVIDFDAHHGNGTQEIFWYDRNVVHIDIHEHGIYPGTGELSDLGGGDAVGSKINIPVPPFSDDSVVAWVLSDVIGHVVSKFLPEAIVVSAGFDGHELDPLTNLEYTDIAYALVGYFLRYLLSNYEIKGITVVLEGGYSVGLRTGIAELLKSFLRYDRKYGRLLEKLRRDCKERYALLINDVLSIIKRYW